MILSKQQTMFSNYFTILIHKIYNENIHPSFYEQYIRGNVAQNNTETTVIGVSAAIL